MEQQRKQLKRNRSWSKDEDDRLHNEVAAKPKPNWNSVARNTGLDRSGNSCRQRWLNHLKPGFRPGKLTDEEKLLVLEFRSLFGKNCWAKIVTYLLPGRRDIDIKNFWHTMAKRANGDVESEAVAKKAELVEKITAAGKFSKDYSSLIPADAYNILSTLLPGLAVEGGGAAAAVAASSSTAAGGAVEGGGAVAASSSTAADALISAYSADVGPTNPFWETQIFPDNVVLQQQMMGTTDWPHQDEWGDLFSDYGGDQIAGTGFNQAAAAAAAAMWGGSNDTGGSDALISAYSADVGPAMEVRHEFPNNPFWDSHIFPDDNVVLMGTADWPHPDEWGELFSDYGGDQIAATMWGGSNDTGNPHNSYGELNSAVNQWGPASGEAPAAKV